MSSSKIVVLKKTINQKAHSLMKEYNTSAPNTQEINTASDLHLMLKQQARIALFELIKAEVDSLCGTIYNRSNESDFHRAGSVEANIFDGNDWFRKRCPRVRQSFEDGTSKGYHLKMLTIAKDTEVWKESFMKAILCGVSFGNMNNLFDARTISKGSLSKLWQERASELVCKMRSESLSDYDMVALMLDGVWLSKNLAAVVALGFDAQGCKKILGFNIGSSENETVCTDLLTSLKERGLREPKDRDLLVVLDGSKALDKSVKNVFNKTIIQRCLIHKERNVRHYAPKKLHGEIAKKFKLLRESRDEEEAKGHISDMKEMLIKYPNALASLKESQAELTSIYSLKIGALLARTFRSTNSIENAFRNVRRHIGRVTSWKEKTCDLWIGSGLYLAQETFRRIKGHEEMGKLIAELGRASPRRGNENDEQSNQSQSNNKSLDLNNKTLKLTA